MNRMVVIYQNGQLCLIPREGLWSELLFPRSYDHIFPKRQQILLSPRLTTHSYKEDEMSILKLLLGDFSLLANCYPGILTFESGE
jgi:hypothetical protein